ncbi:MAG TPA: protein kinase [Phycisphaerales bacterium]|nr:protein kinase [Phycisphaerales bacterium]
MPGSWHGVSMRGSQLGPHSSEARGSIHGGRGDGRSRAAEASFAERLPPPLPEHVGPYRVVRRIGEGGMGAVYLAHRDGESEPRPIAIKVMRVSASGGDMLLRFRRERRVLAGLDHPNIAKLLDAGETEQGEPYFAMEYVDGQPIDEYCDSRRLTVDERVSLFVDVCAAVRHAHGNLVVHRDIKPRNILVTADGSPKLLDFGIAKLISVDAPSGPELPTAPEVRAMTPEYASPEQIRGLPISTSSDVYSLGVVLYELLAGRRPYRFATRSMREVERIVCEGEVRRMSEVVVEPDQRFRIDDEGQLVPIGAPVAPARIAELRSETLPRLRRRLAGDLDTIVLMAMRKEPQRRYASVEALAEDLRRHLAGHPVSAVPDSTAYRLVKFLTRHRAGVAAAASTAAILVLSSAAFAWQAQVARRERTAAVEASRAAELARAEADRQRAEAELQRDRAARRFQQVRDLSTDFAISVNEQIERLEGSTPVRLRLVETSLGHLDGLREDAGDDPALLSRIASAYMRFGDLLGGGRGANLGDAAGALASYRNARAIRAGLVGQDPADLLVRRSLAATDLAIARQLASDGELDLGDDHLRDAIAAIEAMLTVRPDDAENRRMLAVALQQRGDLLASIPGRQEEADALHERSVGLRAALAAEAPESEDRLRDLTTAMSRQARAAVERGDANGAERIYLEQIAIRSRLAEANPDDARFRRDLMLARRSYAEFLSDIGRRAESLAELEAIEPIALRLAAADETNVRAQRDLAMTLDSLGRTLIADGAAEAAVPVLQRALERIEWCFERAPNDRGTLAVSAAIAERLATLIYDDGPEFATALQERSVERWRRHAAAVARGDEAPRGSINVARTLTQLGNMYKEGGRVGDARATLLAAIAEYDAAARDAALPEALAADRSRAIAKLEDLEAEADRAETGRGPWSSSVVAPSKGAGGSLPGTGSLR